MNVALRNLVDLVWAMAPSNDSSSSPPSNTKKRKKSRSRREGALLEEVIVLVVEDDPISQKLIVLLLTGEGAEVHVAQSAEQAMATFDEGLIPDVMVVDIVLPRMSGLLFIEEHLKKDVRMNDTVIVATSALDGVELERMALQAGADVYMRKPFSTESFAATIVTALDAAVSRGTR